MMPARAGNLSFMKVNAPLEYPTAIEHHALMS
jgi:hypothetical protein